MTELPQFLLPLEADLHPEAHSRRPWTEPGTSPASEGKSPSALNRVLCIAACISSAILLCAGDASSATTGSLDKLKLHVLEVRIHGKFLGSGIVVDADKVVTNCHVIANGEATWLKPTVTNDGGATRFGTRLTARNDGRDLCLLSLDSPLHFENERKVRFARSEIREGDDVYAVGAPHGLSGSMTDGIVSSRRPYSDFGVSSRNSFELCRHSDRRSAWYIQTSAKLAPGSSGGGLFNSHGELIGVTTFDYPRVPGSFGFAVPVEYVKELLDLDPSKALKEVAVQAANAGDFAGAVQTANSIDALDVRASALLDIARRQIRSGHHANAEEVLSYAIRVASQISDSGERAERLRMIAQAQTKLTNFTEALAIARRIHDSENRARGLRSIVVALVKAGESKWATEIAREIEDIERRAAALHYIAIGLARMGNFSAAAQVAKEIDVPSERNHALSTVAERQAKALAKEGSFAEAIRTTRGISDLGDRVSTLEYIAKKQAKAGSTVGAQQTLVQARQVAMQIPDLGLRSEVLADLAEDQVKAGCAFASSEIFADAVQAARRIGIAVKRDRALGYVVERMARARLFADAISLAKGIDSIKERDSGLRHVVEALADVEDFTRALRLARSIGALGMQSEALYYISQSLAVVENFSKAAAVALVIPDPAERAKALIDIADARGGWEALDYLDDAIAVVGTMDDPVERDRILSRVVNVQAATANWAQAKSTIGMIVHERHYNRSRRFLAEGYAEAGEFDDAQAVIRSLSRCYPRDRDLALRNFEDSRTSQ